MLYVLISVLIMLALLDRSLRRGRIELLLIEMRFKLFALRDELRRGVIEERMPDNNWFEYLDTSITRAIDLLPTITIWEAVALIVRYRDDEDIRAAHYTLIKEFSTDDNKPFAPVYANFVMCLTEILFRRHIGIRFGISAVIKGIGRARGFKRWAGEIITLAPETSTYYQYASHC